ncbi:MAG: pilus assembly protein [Neisseria sp.]|uniref:pilus assembly PilX family protein n=1 Tax=Neisseria sp. TaxID=192066 RepID=UPI0026DBEB98|nr:pilus assembly protein [Neisseria sp.]MDO4640199.1 pilus assembly protein [Neisseria sp.]
MRKPLIMALPKKQQGFSLFMVLVMMLVIAFLVIAATQSYNTEMRISSNDADRKSAFSLAEAALRQGESEIGKFSNETFSANCTDGLCVQSEQETKSEITAAGNSLNLQLEACGAGCKGINAWERSGVFQTVGKEYKVPDNLSAKPARYIIEALGSNTESDGTIRVIYRVTARAWGENPNTTVTLQSYVEGVYNQ